MTNRFVILHHLIASGEHWDLMLEEKDVLATWQMMSEPRSRDSCPIECRRIKDHRKQYLDYEGSISGGRGFVTRFDYGRFELMAADDDALELRLEGKCLVGDFLLERSDPQSQSRWTLTAC